MKKVIVCQPQYMTIRDVINETQKHFKNEGIHIEKALEQHNQFVDTLRQNHVEVYLLPYHRKYPEQVFTRDIGFFSEKQYLLLIWLVRLETEKKKS